MRRTLGQRAGKKQHKVMPIICIKHPWSLLLDPNVVPNIPLFINTHFQKLLSC